MFESAIVFVESARATAVGKEGKGVTWRLLL